MSSPFKRKACGAVAMLALALLTGFEARAQGKGIDEPFRDAYRKSFEGKTVAYVPAALGFDLAQAWLDGLKRELEPLGVKIVVRDPNWSTNAGAQAISTLIAERPSVLVAHNPDLQTYARLLKKAEADGIPVVQINMRSAYASAVYVGADWIEVGEKLTLAVVEACKGKSNKMAIVQGALSAATSAYTLKGVENVLAKHPEMTVVSSQAGDWDAFKAKGITQTVLKQHPDLCGIVGFWDGMDSGTAAAIAEAGLKGKVFLATSGGGEQKAACEQVESGAFDLYLSYDARNQANTMATAIEWLLQNPNELKQAKGSFYSTLVPITRANASVQGTCWKLAATR
jgi:ribose transport system substrate-binding protein